MDESVAVAAIVLCGVSGMCEEHGRAIGMESGVRVEVERFPRHHMKLIKYC